jgi:hypothetical protein
MLHVAQRARSTSTGKLGSVSEGSADIIMVTFFYCCEQSTACARCRGGNPSAEKQVMSRRPAFRAPSAAILADQQHIDIGQR